MNDQIYLSCSWKPPGLIPKTLQQFEDVSTLHYSYWSRRQEYRLDRLPITKTHFGDVVIGMPHCHTLLLCDLVRTGYRPRRLLLPWQVYTHTIADFNVLLVVFPLWKLRDVTLKELQQLQVLEEYT